MSPQDAAAVAAEGARRAARAGGKAAEETNTLAATAAGIAASKAGKESGKSGEDLATLVATSALASTSGMTPAQQLQSVQTALTKTVEDTGLQPEELDKIAKQVVPAAAASSSAVAGAAGAGAATANQKGSPYQQAEKAGQEAFEAAGNRHETLEAQIASARKASKEAAVKAGLSTEEADKVADAVVNALGGATDMHTEVVTITPTKENVVAGSNGEGYPPLEDRLFSPFSAILEKILKIMYVLCDVLPFPFFHSRPLLNPLAWPSPPAYLVTLSLKDPESYSKHLSRFSFSATPPFPLI